MRTTIFAVLVALVVLCAFATAQETADDWMNKGDELYENGHYEEAFSAYVTASEQYFNDVQLEKSVQALDSALRIDPENVTLWQTKGSILAFMDNKVEEANKAFDRAFQILNQSIEKKPDDVETLLSVAKTFRGMGKYDDAIESIDRVIELDSKNIDARFYKAEFLTLAGRYSEATDVYGETIEMIPADETSTLTSAWSMMGNSFYDDGRYKDAINAYDKAIEISPEDAGAWGNKGLALIKLGEPEEALKMFNKAAELDPVHSGGGHYAYVKGTALKAMGRYNESLELFDEAIEVYPNNPLIWVEKGEVLLALNRSYEANVAFDKAENLGYNSDTIGYNKI